MDERGKLVGSAGEAECQMRLFRTNQFFVRFIVCRYGLMVEGIAEYVIVLAIILFDCARNGIQLGSGDDQSQGTVRFQPADKLVLRGVGRTAQVVIIRLLRTGNLVGGRFLSFFA